MKKKLGDNWYIYVMAFLFYNFFLSCHVIVCKKDLINTKSSELPYFPTSSGKTTKEEEYSACLYLFSRLNLPFPPPSIICEQAELFTAFP